MGYHQGPGRRTGRGWPSLVLAGGLGVLMVLVLLGFLSWRRYSGDCGGDPERNELVMVSGEDVNPGRRRQELINAWNDNKQRKGPRVRLVELAGGTDHEYSQLLAAMQLGSCAYDVLSIDVVWLPAFAREGYLEPVPDGRFDYRNFLLGPWRTGTGDDNRQYAIPFHSDVGLLYYRKDIVGDTAPRTWDELRRMVTPENLDRLRTTDAAGLVTQLADYEGLTVNGMEMAWGSGGDVRKEGNRIVVDAAAERGLQHMVDDLRRSENGNSTVILKASAGFRENESAEAFTRGRALFLRNWPYAYHVLHIDPLVKGRFAVAELPGPDPSTPGSGALGGQTLAVSRNALHKKDAWDFIQWLTEAEQQRRLFACGGYVPVRKEVYEDVAQCSQLPAQREQNDQETTELSTQELTDLAAVLERVLARARARPDVPNYPGFSRAFHRYLHDAIVDGTVVRRGPFADQLTACAGWKPPVKNCP